MQTTIPCTVGYSNVREDDNILLHNFRNDLHIT